MRILFWFRKSEAKNQTAKSDPVGSIACRITIQNVSVELGSTSVRCVKSKWDPENQRIDGGSLRANKGNRTLTENYLYLENLYNTLLTKYEYVSPSTVKDYYFSKKKFHYSIGEIIQLYISQRENLSAQGALSSSSLEVETNYSRHFQDYCDHAKISRPIEIGESFLFDFFGWMLGTGRAGENFTRKVCVFIKALLRWTIKKKYTPTLSVIHEHLPGKAYDEDDLDTTHLSIVQLNKLYKFDFDALVEGKKLSKESASTLKQERDAFVFNCFTGMHHCDYKQKHFWIEDYRGARFLKGKRKKTKKPFAIRLLEPALRILDLYGGDLKDLPVKSNQKRNATLKQIAIILEFPLLLTTKIARKTFCDLALNEMMMTPDDVVACLGLTSTRYLKNYGRIREKRLMSIMKSWQELKAAS